MFLSWSHLSLSHFTGMLNTCWTHVEHMLNACWCNPSLVWGVCTGDHPGIGSLLLVQTIFPLNGEWCHTKPLAELVHTALDNYTSWSKLENCTTEIFESLHLSPAHLQDMILGFLEELSSEFLFHLWIQHLEEGMGHRLCSLCVPLLH